MAFSNTWKKAINLYFSNVYIGSSGMVDLRSSFRHGFPWRRTVVLSVRHRFCGRGVRKKYPEKLVIFRGVQSRPDLVFSKGNLAHRGIGIQRIPRTAHQGGDEEAPGNGNRDSREESLPGENDPLSVSIRSFHNLTPSYGAYPYKIRGVCQEP